MRRDKSAATKHFPNRIRRNVRVSNALMGAYLLAWGGSGLYSSRLVLGVRRNVVIAVLWNGPAWLMAAAMICGAMVMLSVLVDHYDLRDNEGSYRAFRWVLVRLGWCLFAASLVSHLYLFFSGSPMR